MNFAKATRKYEAWVEERTTPVAKDLRIKHQRMKESPFAFFRATFYRWAQLWPELCDEVAKAPELLAVGDLHVENFGTWRDHEGRLVWGVNDFDEVHPLAYTNDLVRLAVSAMLAREEGVLTVGARDTCDVILEGYTKQLERGGSPFVLEEEHPWLREVATGGLRDPVHFWEKMDALPRLKRAPPDAVAALESLLPEKGLGYSLRSRVAGLGSLGHLRIVAIAEWRGGLVAREAKALTPSACEWAHRDKAAKRILYAVMLEQAVRCPDPFVKLCGRWIVRRLAPHCTRIDLASLPKKRDEERLLYSMGGETANMHFGSEKRVKRVRKHLRKSKAGWLHESAKAMAAALEKDWKEWRRG
jgi:uncharacterized protein DUF2252